MKTVLVPPPAQAPLGQAIDYYLALRRQLGFALENEGRLLADLAAYAQESQHRGPLTKALMVAWAQASAQASVRQQARRLEIARRFAQFWVSFDPATEVPPAGLLGPSSAVRRAYIYSPEQIGQLLQAAGQLSGPPAWRALTFQTLLGLLACTGMRLSEALHLQRQDVQGASALLTLPHTKGGQSRCLVLQPSTRAALEHYDHQRPAANGPAPFFSLRTGEALRPSTVEEVFDHLRRRLGWTMRPPPRLHDLRHTFAVRCLIGWYEQGAEQVDQKMLALSTYLGHVNPASTYWYLSAVPQLMALVQARWQNAPTPIPLPKP